VDTLLPGETAVMALGVDSLELVRHPPRPQAAAAADGGGRWLDLCCGSGVQGISAACWGRAAQVSPARALPGTFPCPGHFPDCSILYPSKETEAHAAVISLPAALLMWGIVNH
jgi:hypothetical protein